VLVKVKVKWSSYRPGVAQRVGRGIVLLFHDRGTRRGWVVSSTPWPHFTHGKDPVPILQEAGWAPGPIWTDGKPRPHRDSIPDRPAIGPTSFVSTAIKWKEEVHTLRRLYMLEDQCSWIPHDITSGTQFFFLLFCFVFMSRCDSFEKRFFYILLHSATFYYILLHAPQGLFIILSSKWDPVDQLLGRLTGIVIRFLFSVNNF